MKKIILIFIKIKKLLIYFIIFHGDWGLGIGPNPQSPLLYIKFSIYKKLIQF